MPSINSLYDLNNLPVEKTDYVLGKGLQMPFAASNSGARKLMFGIQLEHRLALCDPQVPFIQTGYEMEFGKNSSSYVQVPEDMTVIGKVSKFSWMPDHHYYLFLLNNKDNTLSVYERKEYKHITENYGYLYNNEYIDRLTPGNTVPKGTVIQRSIAFDEYNNRMDGRDFLTMYASCEETMEDAIVISESASQKMRSPLVKKVNIIVNDNDIPLNLYGDANTYKIFPNIGEESKNSILCGFRREKKEESLYSQSYARLRELAISDERYTVAGRVVDVDVYCNAPANLSEYEYNSQLLFYYNEQLRVAQEITEIIGPFVDIGYKLDYELQMLYSNAKGILSGKQYFSEKAFSNTIIEITLIEEIPVMRGDKLSNRYGGKGITAEVKPDALMPKTKDGRTIDVILNMCGVYGRENTGQLFEITVSYVSMKILEYINMNVLPVEDCVQLYLELLSIVSPSMHDYMQKWIESLTDDECIELMSDITRNESSLFLVIEPMSENMTIDKVKQLYDAFPFIKPEFLYMPVINSKGEIRYAKSRRPLIYGYQYIYRLKQYAEEKFSVTSLSATNIRNENSKSKMSNNYKALYSRTPIRFGDMEIGNLTHLGGSLIVQQLMIYSTSPTARRLTSSMLTGDAFNIDVKLDMKSKNRNVEILNAYLKTMGLKLVFSKKKKQYESPIEVFPVMFDDRLEDPVGFRHPDEKFDIEKEVQRLLAQKHMKDPIAIYPVEFRDGHQR